MIAKKIPKVLLSIEKNNCLKVTDNIQKNKLHNCVIRRSKMLKSFECDI